MRPFVFFYLSTALDNRLGFRGDKQHSITGLVECTLSLFSCTRFPSSHMESWLGFIGQLNLRNCFLTYRQNCKKKITIYKSVKFMIVKYDRGVVWYRSQKIRKSYALITLFCLIICKSKIIIIWNIM